MKSRAHGKRVAGHVRFAYSDSAGGTATRVFLDLVEVIEEGIAYQHYDIDLADMYRFGMTDQERYEQCERLMQRYAEEASRLRAKLQS